MLFVHVSAPAIAALALLFCWPLPLRQALPFCWTWPLCWALVCLFLLTLPLSAVSSASCCFCIVLLNVLPLSVATSACISGCTSALVLVHLPGSTLLSPLSSKVISLVDQECCSDGVACVTSATECMAELRHISPAARLLNAASGDKPG